MLKALERVCKYQCYVPNIEQMSMYRWRGLSRANNLSTFAIEEKSFSKTNDKS